MADRLTLIFAKESADNLASRATRCELSSDDRTLLAREILHAVSRSALPNDSSRLLSVVFTVFYRNHRAFDMYRMYLINNKI